MDQALDNLLQRSNRLGSDKRVTNFAGGNTSAKVTLPDPVTGDPTRVLAVKGSGGDLGTLTYDGLALLDLDRVLCLERSHASGVHEDDLVARYAYCKFGHGGAVPSIDTPLHAFIDADHVDHLHPDAMIALAASLDGETLTKRCYGSEVGWLDWQRPGFELGLSLRDFRSANPSASGAIMGGHGMICWADTSSDCEALTLQLIERAEAFLAKEGLAEPFGSSVTSAQPLDHQSRRDAAAALAPHVRRIATRDRLMVACFTDTSVVLDFLAAEAAPGLAQLGMPCPDHFLRTKIRPLFLDLPPTASHDQRVERLDQLHSAYRGAYTAYYEAHFTPTSPAMRGADPAIVLIPGIGMWSFGVDAHTARVAGDFYLNAINIMRGAESVSTYRPISDAEKFGVEYWELEERKLQMRPPAPALEGRVALVTGGASGIGKVTAEQLARNGACVVIADLDLDGAKKTRDEAGADRCIAVECDVSDERSVASAFAEAALSFGSVDLVVNSAGFAQSTALVDTDVEDWNTLYAVFARGSFLVSRDAARHMIATGRGGDIIHIISKNAIVAGPANAAYGSAKASQAHLVRLLATELGPHGIRVNGVNPDGVVKGSGIFSGEWLADRANVYGVAPDKLGDFYASRTLLGSEVLPTHVAEGVFALVAGSLSRTSGHIIPVDGGLAPAFLR